jgi:diacylglycerol O-acyltransferase / wax synthase
VPESVDVFMRDSDAFSWYMERDPALRSTIVAVAWLEGRPRWETLVDRIEWATRAIPVFRMRLVEPPARLSTPRWTVDSGFDLDWHIRRVDAPSPHTAATVVDLAAVAATTAFDMAHPLWEFTLVGHLEDGRAALLMKLHHSLTDGIGGMELALRLFDSDVAASRRVSREPLPPAPTGEDVHGLKVVRDSLGHDWGRVVRAVGGELRNGPAAVMQAARHPLRTAADVAETMRSIGRTVAPVWHTRSPVMSGRSLRRRLDIVTVGLPELKGSAAAAGGSLNDGFLAALTGGLRHYHHVHGAAADELRVTLPISIRKRSDPVGGNRITLQRLGVPLTPGDPAARIGEIGRRCRAARDERSLPHTNAIAGALNLLPSGLVGGMLKHVDFVASNVPGFTFPVYLAGSHVTGYTPFGPTIGASLNATLLSYDGTCFVGVTIDEAAVPDPDVLMGCIAEGFDEVLALGGHGSTVCLPMRTGSFPGEEYRGRAGPTARLNDRPVRTGRKRPPSRGGAARA